MSRKRDTNWNRDEITVLLDSIVEITRMRAADGKRTNSREVFEYAAKRLGEKGHSCRAEREKCRTKWKKMKEEFTHAKKARDGDSRYKEAPGIQPFYDRMEEFIYGNFDNISPHSTIVRRSSSMSSSNNTSTATTSASSSSSSSSSGRISSVSRSSARIAANNTTASSGTPSNERTITAEANDLSTNNHNNNALATADSLGSAKSAPSSNTSMSSRQATTRLSSTSDTNINITSNHISNNLFPPSTVTNNNVTNNGNNARCISNLSNHHSNQNHINQHHRQQNDYSQSAATQQQLHQPYLSMQHQTITAGDIAASNATYNHLNGSHNNQNIVNSSPPTNSHSNNNVSTVSHNNDSSSNHHQQAPPLPAEHADISYRVGTGCRQITIFGDHDVDIKFRGDCVTINKISNDYNNCSLGVPTAGFKAHGNNSSTNNHRDMEDNCIQHT